MMFHLNYSHKSIYKIQLYMSEIEFALQQSQYKIKELSDLVIQLDEENTKLKDIINSQNWEASPFEKDYIHFEITNLRKKIENLERDLNATTITRNMFMNRNAELIRSNNGLKGLMKKYKLQVR